MTLANMASVTQIGVIKFSLKEETMSHIFVWKFEDQVKNLFTFLKLQNKSYVDTEIIHFSTGSLSNFDHSVKFYAVPREDNKSFWIYCKMYIGDTTDAARERFKNISLDIKAVTVSAVGHLEKAVASDLETTFPSEEINSSDGKVMWWKKLCIGGIYTQIINASQLTFVIQTHNRLWDDSDLKMHLEPPGTENYIVKHPGMLNTKSLYLSEKYSDIIIECKDREFPAHRVIISSKSEVFATMFDSPMKESEEGRLIIEDADPEVVEQMLQFIYTGQADLNKLAEELFLIADKYCIQDLKDISENILVQKVDENNFLDLYHVGKLLSSAKMIDRCYEIFKRKRKDILKTEKDLRRFYEKYPELMFRFSTD